MQRLESKVLHFIRRHGLLDGCGRAVVGFSGGPDSTALVLMLTELARSGALDLQLHLAHLNHSLRGEESDADEAFCRAFAAEHGLQIAVEQVDVAALAARNGRSIEAEARVLRYGFLGRAAQSVCASAVVTGHHADDVAESVLLRLLRGAGVLGLGAMAPQRPLSAQRPGVRLVRPLLDLRRQEVLDYLERRGQSYRTDRSNADAAYARNRVRHTLIPALQRDFPTFSVASLCALNESAVETEQLLSALLDAAWNDVCRELGDGEAVLDADAFSRLPVPLRKAAARRALDCLAGGRGPALRADHYAGLAGLASAPVGTELSLPGGAFARREHGGIYLALKAGAVRIRARQLPVPGAVCLPEVGLRISCEVLPAGRVDGRTVARLASDLEVFVGAGALNSPLTVRSRRPGDRFRPLGAPGEARLKEFFINSKVPAHERDRIPLVTSSEAQIIWVVGKRIAEPFKLGDQGGPALRLRAAPIEQQKG